MLVLTIIAYLAPLVLATAYVQDMISESRENIYAKF